MTQPSSDTPSLSPVIVALDVSSQSEALAIAERLDPKLCRVKVGKQLFTHEGPAVVKALHALGFDVFLDLKFHDIPNTVAQAVTAAAQLGVWMVNVHALGGAKMMAAAKAALAHFEQPPLLIAVTVLTSHREDYPQELGLEESIQDLGAKLAKRAYQAGLDGVVCSAYEASAIKQVTADDFITVTPGIRFADQDSQDQSRVMTPEKALANGSDYLVMGRSIVGAEDPISVIRLI
ncbi:MAG: orotidine-5'-phosphate decarboxylase [Pseudomonadota bacterium]|nr:orotidine-5'-phosphate decarboxylase [Pseudomonadota bacterium]